MRRGGWHMGPAPDGGVTLARRWPARMDVAAQTHLPAGPAAVRARVLAHEVRKDVWRALRRVRAASPVVRVAPAACGGVTVTAGLRLDRRPGPPGLSAAIAAVLADPARRRRWLAHAGRRGGTGTGEHARRADGAQGCGPGQGDHTPAHGGRGCDRGREGAEEARC